MYHFLYAYVVTYFPHSWVVRSAKDNITKILLPWKVMHRRFATLLSYLAYLQILKEHKWEQAAVCLALTEVLEGLALNIIVYHHILNFYDSQFPTTVFPYKPVLICFFFLWCQKCICFKNLHKHLCTISPSSSQNNNETIKIKRETPGTSRQYFWFSLYPHSTVFYLSTRRLRLVISQEEECSIGQRLSQGRCTS